MALVRESCSSLGFFFRKNLWHSSIRSVRTVRNKERILSDAEIDEYFNEDIQKTGFGGIRRDSANSPKEYETSDDRSIDRAPEAVEELPRIARKKTSSSNIDLAKPPETTGKSMTSKKKRPKFNTVTSEDVDIRSIRKRTEDADQEEPSTRTAFQAVKEAREKAMEPGSNQDRDSLGFRILKAEIKPQIWTMNKDEVFKCLLRRVIFDSPEVLVLDKPYGLSMHGGGDKDKRLALVSYLSDMAKAFNVEKLYPVHRLDKEVTGVLCIAKNKEMAHVIESLFKARQVKKEYVAITKGIPQEKEGIIEAPIAEGKIDGRSRMVIVPTAEPGSNKSVPKFSKVFPAVTRYKVVAQHNCAASIRLLPETGYRHQLRVHLGFHLGCPVLGDHKYSHPKKLLPQKLPGDILDKLKVRQQKSRDIPLHLHARHMVIPGVLANNRNLVISAPYPGFFTKNRTRLLLA